MFLQDGTEIDDEEYYEDLDDQVIIYLSNSPKFILESIKGILKNVIHFISKKLLELRISVERKL